MVPEENPATDGGGEDGGTSPPEDGPQMGQGEQGTDALEETAMELDQQDGLGNEARTGLVQEPPIGLPPLERRRQLEIVSTVAQISLLAQAMGGTLASEGSRRQERQAAQQEERELGELPFTKEQMRHAGSLLQERVAQEQRQKTDAPARRHAAITAELSTERQARQMAERRIAELEAQMASIRPPAQRLVQQHSARGQQAAPMLPRPLQMGAIAQRPVLGGLPQMAPPTYSQVAQRPPRQAALRPAAPL